MLAPGPNGSSWPVLLDSIVGGEIPAEMDAETLIAQVIDLVVPLPAG